MKIGSLLRFFLVFLIGSIASEEKIPSASIKGINYYKYTSPTENDNPPVTTGLYLLNQKKRTPERLLKPPDTSVDLNMNEDLKSNTAKNGNSQALIRKSRHYYASDAYKYGYYDRYGRFQYNDWSYPYYSKSYYDSDYYNYPSTRSRTNYNDYNYPATRDYYYGGYTGDFSYGKNNYNSWRGSSYYSDNDYYYKKRINDDYYDNYYDNNRRYNTLGNYNNYNNYYDRYRFWKVNC